MLLILFFIGFFYSFIIQRLSKSTIIMLIPNILRIILIIYTKITSKLNDSYGLGSLRTIIKEFIIAAIIVENISRLIFFALRNKLMYQNYFSMKMCQFPLSLVPPWCYIYF